MNLVVSRRCRMNPRQGLGPIRWGWGKLQRRLLCALHGNTSRIHFGRLTGWDRGPQRRDQGIWLEFSVPEFSLGWGCAAIRFEVVGIVLDGGGAWLAEGAEVEP